MSRTLAAVAASLIVMALAACSPPAEAPASDAPTPGPAAAKPAAPEPTPAADTGPATPEELANGGAIFARTCVLCHGPDGQGVPDKGEALKTKDLLAIREKVTRGIIKAGDKMPPLGAAMSEDELDDLSKYVASIVK